MARSMGNASNTRKPSWAQLAVVALLQNFGTWFGAFGPFGDFALQERKITSS